MLIGQIEGQMQQVGRPVLSPIISNRTSDHDDNTSLGSKHTDSPTSLSLSLLLHYLLHIATDLI
jgi:hypothetical protein